MLAPPGTKFRGPASAFYNRGVRKTAVFLLICCVAACHRNLQDTEAVRQTIVDTLKARGDLNLQAMDVNVESVQFNGGKADASVSFALKGNSQPMMRMVYHLEQKDGKWVVASRGDSGHGMASPEQPNPHGAGGKMPAPEDLPPAGKKP
jgi:hypothetical protein